MPATSLIDQQDLTPEAIMERLRRQLEADCELGLFAPCTAAELDEVARASVQALWAESRIKTYVPILALRRARNAIGARPAPEPVPA